MLSGFAAMSEFKNGKSFNASLFEHCTEKLKEQVESYSGQLTDFLNISQQALTNHIDKAFKPLQYTIKFGSATFFQIAFEQFSNA